MKSSTAFDCLPLPNRNPGYAIWCDQTTLASAAKALFHAVMDSLSVVVFENETKDLTSVYERLAFRERLLAPMFVSLSQVSLFLSLHMLQKPAKQR